MRIMWEKNPDDRPDFKEINSAIRILTSTEHGETGYSYTMTDTEQTEGQLPEGYEVPVSSSSEEGIDRQLSNDSGPYADRPASADYYND